MSEWIADNTPTKDEIADAVEVLRRVERGHLPRQLFLEVARLIVTPTIELAPLRKSEGQLEILLTKRPDNDEYWPGQWHIPGVVVLSSDIEDSFASATGRIMEGELGGKIAMKGVPQLAGVKFHDIARGRELDHVFYLRQKLSVISCLTTSDSSRLMNCQKT